MRELTSQTGILGPSTEAEFVRDSGLARLYVAPTNCRALRPGARPSEQYVSVETLLQSSPEGDHGVAGQLESAVKELESQTGILGPSTEAEFFWDSGDSRIVPRADNELTIAAW